MRTYFVIVTRFRNYRSLIQISSSPRSEQPSPVPLVRRAVMTSALEEPAKSLAPFIKRTPYANPLWPIHLFFNKKFTVHRFLGLVYLVQYLVAWRMYLTDYEGFAKSPLIWALPLNGVVQALSATYYFSFLPKKADPGYYSDRSALSYDFVKENIFFSSILLWQWVYYCPTFYGPLTTGRVLTVVEHAFVFLPYFFRDLVPKTSFRASMKSDTNKTEGNAYFFFIVTHVTKLFYLWAKWYIGFFFNYLRYLNLVNDNQRREMYRLLLFSAFATTVSMFLHTLKFKGYMGPRTAFLTYMASYLATFYSIVRLYTLFLGQTPLVGITLVAMLLNRFGHLLAGKRYLAMLGGERAPLLGQAWQLVTMGLLLGVRSGYFGMEMLSRVLIATVCAFGAWVF